MPFAARIGDITSHGKPLGPGPGSPNVIIGKMPAWRAGMDFHMCPILIAPPAPATHVGGVVAKGSANVFINKMPAARQGDMIIEAGPPNTITMGCPTVNIGG